MISSLQWALNIQSGALDAASDRVSERLLDGAIKDKSHVPVDITKWVLKVAKCLCSADCQNVDSNP